MITVPHSVVSELSFGDTMFGAVIILYKFDWYVTKHVMCGACSNVFTASLLDDRTSSVCSYCRAINIWNKTEEVQA